MTVSMRIALTHAFCWPEVRRGGERYLHELGASLARRGHEVTIFGGASRRSRDTEDGVRTVRIARGPAAAPDASQRFASDLLRRLLVSRFDVVHSLGPLDAVAGLRARSVRRNRRTVYTELGNPVRAWWDTLGDKNARERVVEEIDVFGCLSQHALSCLHADYGREGVLTPGGVRLDRFVPSDQREADPTLLYSGALDEPRKGVALLLQVLPLVARSHPRVKLWLSGSGETRQLLDEASPEARDRTLVLPLGEPEYQAARYGRAWATVLPSIDEAFGLVLVESLACGTPIVGCDHAAIPELVRPGIGALAAPNDAASLTAACIEALELSTERQTTESCREAARPHDWDASVTPATEAAYAG